MSHFLFYICLLTLALNQCYSIVILAYMIRCLSMAHVYYKIKERLQARLSLLKFILFDFVHIFFYMFFVIPVLIPQKSKW